jgi:hypothetical protein
MNKEYGEQPSQNSARLDLHHLVPDSLQSFLEDRSKGEEALQRGAAIVRAMSASADSPRGGAEPESTGCSVGRARPYPRRAAVADAHLWGDVAGAELFGPFLCCRLEPGPVIVLGSDISFAFPAIQPAISN